jgi:integrase
MTKTVEEWLNEWLEVYVKPCKKKNTYLCYKYVTKMMFEVQPQAKNKLLSNFTEMEIQKWINSLSVKYSKSTIKKASGILDRAYKIAVRNHLCKENPATCIMLPEASEKVVRALTQSEQKQVEATAKTDHLGHIVLFFLNTGLRAGELINLKWEDYDKDREEIYVRSSKTKAGIRTVPLLPEAKNIIEAQPHYCDYIFTSTAKRRVTKIVLKRLYMRLRKRTGITFLTNHVYRHSFATRAVESGIDYKALSVILGHTNVAFTLHRYTNAENDFLREQIRLLIAKKAS